jgi:hypothetical protein
MSTDLAKYPIDRGSWTAWNRYKAGIKPGADRIEAAIRDPRNDAIYWDVTHKSSPVGRVRAARKLARLMTGARFDRADGGMIWTWRKPTGAVFKDDPDHFGSVTCSYLVLTPTQKSLAWSLTVSDHAGARMVQRGDPGLDVDRALAEAHDAVMAASDEEVRAASKDGREFLLPTGGGAFICTAGMGRDSSGRSVLFAQAHTWIHEDMRHDEHQPLVALHQEGVSLGDVMIATALQPPHLEGQSPGIG